MDAMQEKAPRAKMARRADFSRPGRWMLRRTLSGRKRIQTSMRMLAALVAVEERKREKKIHVACDIGEGHVLYMKMVVLMQWPGMRPVKSHIL
jgi:hypothetical protein